MPGGALSAGLLGAALLVVAVLGSRPAGTTGALRVLLVALRWLSAAALWLLAAQPSWWGERLAKDQGAIAVLWDTSASMGVGNPSRGSRAAALIERWRSSADGARARFYTLGDGVKPLAAGTKTLEVPAESGRTALWDGVEQLAGEVGQLGALVVVSDGADTTERAPPQKLDVRVHAVSVPDRTPLRDDGIASLHADAVAFLRSEGRVQADIRSSGLPAHEATIRLIRQGAASAQGGRSESSRVVDQQTVQLPEDGSVSVELRFEPAALGRELYALELDEAPQDDIPSNNRRAFIVRVTRDRLRVLHVSGRPSWDQRFLRGFLKRDPSIDLISFFILRSTFDLPNSDTSEMALIPFPTDELFSVHLSSFDVVILQNFNFGPYRMEGHLPRIAQYVREGGALAMLGGDLSFEAGGYATTPLASVLPVSLSDGGPKSKLAPGSFRPVLVRELARHPLLELHPDRTQNLSAWASLEPLTDVHRFLGLREGGHALLVHPKLRAGAERLPVLAAGRFGKGRSLALGTDTTWHWSMPTAAAGGDPAVYDRFWDRALRWLAKDPLLDPSQLSTDRERYAPGQAVHLRGVARGPDYTPRQPGEVSLWVVSPSEGDVQQVTVEPDVDGNLEAHFEAPTGVGIYELVLREGGSALASVPFLVERGGAELADPRPAPKALAELAIRTGGRSFATPEKAPDLASLDAVRTRTLGTERMTPFSTPWTAALVVALLCLEWWLRRRSALP